jgi:hypothetical protein
VRRGRVINSTIIFAIMHDGVMDEDLLLFIMHSLFPVSTSVQNISIQYRSFLAIGLHSNVTSFIDIMKGSLRVK